MEKRSAEPWLTVLMPTLNGEAYLAESLDSVARQPNGVRVILVDGGSTDGTVEVARRYLNQIDLDILQCPESKGWVWSTNLALGLTQTPYACLLHQDDTWRGGRVAAMRAKVATQPNAALHLCDSDFVAPDGRVVGPWRCPWNASGLLDQGELLRALLVQDFIACPAPVFRTDAARAVGGLDTELWYTADWDFWLKLARHGQSTYTAERLVAFRVHPQSLTVTGSAGNEDFFEQMQRVADRHRVSIAGDPRKQMIERAGRFSNRLNASLASVFHGGRAAVGRLLIEAVALGPVGLCHYLRSSRIVERVAARLRAGFVAS
jgi:hypothetical protein